VRLPHPITWWRRRTLRERLLVIGISGLCAGLALGGVVLVAALSYVLQRSVDGELDRTASDVAALVDAGRLPQPVPVAGTAVVQVVDDHGRVRAASIDGDRLVPMLHPDELARARAGEKLFIEGERLGLDGDVRVVAVPAGPVDDPQTVLAARSLSDAFKGIHVLQTTLLIVFPLLVLALALVAWRVIGATLRPVEALRRGAEEITGTGQSGRLPVPVGEDEIHRLATTLNGMLARLESGRARQREFVADAAHELRSPLANMRTQLEIAQRLGPATDWPALADDLLIDTARLARLVEDLLLLARSDASPGLHRAGPVDLAALARDVAARYPGATVVVPDDPLWTVGEPDGLTRVVANLLENAVRHARARVYLTVTAPGGRPLITVTDDGPGIPVADRDRVFERFTRLDDGRARDDGGTGLGLAIVRELVRKHGGTVALDDAGAGPNPGLRVRVHLPAAPLP
jgi:signal transduction histidine kinase